MADQKIKCQKCSKDFLVIAQEVAFYKKKDLPMPVHCPNCRRWARERFKNPRELHKRKCGKCNKEILTTYPPDSPYLIYCQKCYWESMD